MIVLLSGQAPEDLADAVFARVGGLPDHTPRLRPLHEGALLRLPGVCADEALQREIAALPGVARVVAGDPSYFLASREFQPDDSLVQVGPALFGGTEVVLIGGPCSVDERDLLRRAAEQVASAGGRLLRGGAYKPRTSPYSFQGLGPAGLEMLARVGEEFGLGVVTEVMAPEDVPLVSEHCSMLQLGSRSVQNFPLLEAVGAARRPVLLKRGMMSTLDEFLASAEYVMAGGNRDVVLCERGIRGFDRATRNVLDVVGIALLQELTHLPVVADPSHATGRRDLVLPAARAAVAAGADGLLVEVHPEPERALSDGPQALRPEVLPELAGQLDAVARAVGRRVLPG